MLILHECMGRGSGYLTSATAKMYRNLLAKPIFVEGFTYTAALIDIHAIWIPGIPKIHFDLETAGAHLKTLMDKYRNLNVSL